MILNSQRFSLLVFMVVLTIAGLLFYGIHSMSERDLVAMKKDQLRKKQIIPEELQPIEEVAYLAVKDYFRMEGPSYQYLGGLFDSDLVPDQLYDQPVVHRALQSAASPAEKGEGFYAQSIGRGSLYINVDQGIRDPVKQFLESLDAYQNSQFDTLFIDFRFIREVDFSQLIALFNQLSPREKIKLGTVKSAYRETEIKTSGQPFFNADLYVFLVNSYIPESLKKLIQPFQSRNGYEVWGEIGPVPDKVCVFTKYEIKGDHYRICTEQFYTPKRGSETTIAPQEVREELQEMFFQINEFWYGRSDSAYMASQLPMWLK